MVAPTGSSSVAIASRGIVTDCQGNIYVIGSLQGTVQFGPITVHSTEVSPFIAKLNYNGEWQFVKIPTQILFSGNFDTAAGISFDCNGNLYVVGGFRGTLQWDPTLTPLDAGPSLETYVVRLDTNGNFAWEVQTVAVGPAANSTQPFGIDNDCQGNIYITGTINGSPVLFGTTTLTPSGTGRDAYIAKLDPSDAFVWANQSTSTTNSHTEPRGIVNDCQGNIFIVGNLSANPPVQYQQMLLLVAQL